MPRVRPELIRPFWPNMQVTAEALADAPHQRIRQVVDRSYSKRHLAQLAEADLADSRYRARNLRDLHATLAAIGRRYAGRRVLTVVQQTVEEALPALPANIDLAAAPQRGRRPR